MKTNTTICNKIDIKKVDINGLTITTNVNKTGSTSGGFLGHNWYRVKVTLSDLKISNSKLNVSSYELGGLVLSTTGYWNVKTIHFANDVKISNSRCFRFGMLSGTLFGRSYDSYGFDYMNAINYNKAICGSDATYFELTGIGDKGYVIDDSTELSLSKCEYFDEITRSSIYGDAANPVSGQNAIISIPAVNDKNERLLYMDGEHCNTYQNQTKNNGATWKDNPCARYYYNLDVYKNGKASTGGAKAVEWSAKLFAANNIKAYINSTNIDFPTDPEIDLTGYSFYPVDTNGCNIKSNSTITFENNGFNQSEMV